MATVVATATKENIHIGHISSFASLALVHSEDVKMVATDSDVTPARVVGDLADSDTTLPLR
jgi:hypothetical protein